MAKNRPPPRRLWRVAHAVAEPAGSVASAAEGDDDGKTTPMGVITGIVKRAVALTVVACSFRFRGPSQAGFHVCRPQA